MSGEKRSYRPDTRRHIIPCAACGKDVLDHMAQCPHCKAPLTPKGWDPRRGEALSKTQKTVRAVFWVAAALAAGVALYLRYRG